MYKITNNLILQYLSDILPPQIKEIPPPPPPNLKRLRQGINSRLSIGDYTIPIVRTKLSELSFPVVGSKLWNSLPTEGRTKPTLGPFSKALNKIFPSDLLQKETKNLYSLGSWLVNIQHTCLRLGCSKLNHYLKENLNVTDDSSCACNYPNEDTSHFFLFSPYIQISEMNCSNHYPLLITH